MKTYICNLCGNIDKFDTFNESTACRKCGATFDKLKIIESDIKDDEIDAIIDSVIEDVMELKDSKIVNVDEKNKRIEIDEENPCIYRNTDKCINCGQCKKTCENFANITYNLNEIKNPICIGCGKCIRNCPEHAINQIQCSEDVKSVIAKNEQIVVAIVEPLVPAIIFDKLKLEKDNCEYKLNDILKSIGFDYIFNSSLACDMNIIEEVSEFTSRLKNKGKLPIINSNCPSFEIYTSVYHKDITDNLSTVKNSLQMMGQIIKKCFCDKKGFNKEKIINVGITTCLAKKMEIVNYGRESSIDYILTIDELLSIIKSEEISTSNLNIREYDDYNEYSSYSLLSDILGGQSEVFAKTFSKLMSKENDDKGIDYSVFRNIKGTKDVNIQIGKYSLRIAIVNNLKDFSELINSGKYKQYHYIEVKTCINGCLDGNGFDYNNEFDKSSVIDYIYKESNKSSTKFPYTNKELKKIYSDYFVKPLSDLSINEFHKARK